MWGRSEGGGITKYKEPTVIKITPNASSGYQQTFLVCVACCYNHVVFVVTWPLRPHKTAAVSEHILFTPYNYAPTYSVAQIHIIMFLWMHTGLL